MIFHSDYFTIFAIFAGFLFPFPETSCFPILETNIGKTGNQNPSGRGGGGGGLVTFISNIGYFYAESQRIM